MWPLQYGNCGCGISCLRQTKKYRQSSALTQFSNNTLILVVSLGLNHFTTYMVFCLHSCFFQSLQKQRKQRTPCIINTCLKVKCFKCILSFFCVSSDFNNMYFASQLDAKTPENQHRKQRHNCFRYSTQVLGALESTFKMTFHYVISLKNDPRSISKITFVNLNWIKGHYFALSKVILTQLYKYCIRHLLTHAIITRGFLPYFSLRFIFYRFDSVTENSSISWSKIRGL